MRVRLSFPDNFNARTMVSSSLFSMSSCSLIASRAVLSRGSVLPFFAFFAIKNVWIPVFTEMTRNAKPRQLYFFSTSRAITMRMTSDAPSVIIRLR